MSLNNVDLVLCGNPGTGKSTILSSISKVQFRSGISFGAGLTARLQFQTSPPFPGVRFGDTPGLADVEMAEAAAEAITEALQDGASKGRNAKIFFVIMEINGRVRSDDLFTIKQVMSSIKLPGGKKVGPNEYGIIVNQCSLMDHPRFNEGKKKIEAVFYDGSKLVPYTTSYITFLPEQKELKNKDNAQFVFDKDFFQWIFKFPGIQVSSACKIDVSDIEELLVKVKQEHKKELDAIEKRLSNQNEQMQKKHDQLIADMERKMKESGSRNKVCGDILEQIAGVVPIGKNVVRNVRAMFGY